MKPISISKFDGANKFYGAAIKTLFNYLVTKDLKLKKAPAFKSIIQLAKAHSLFSYGNILLFVGRVNEDDNDSVYLYNLDSKALSRLYQLPFKDVLMFYVFIDPDYCIFSNSQWHGVFNGSSILIPQGSRPPCNHIVFYQSRIVGSRDSILIYSEPFDYFEMKDTNFIEFGSTINAVYALSDRLIVGTEEETFALVGDFPFPKQVKINSAGIIPNTITKITVKENEMLTWATPISIVIYDGEKVININSNKIEFTAKGVGSSFCYPLLNFSGIGLSDAEMGDDMDLRVIRNGKII